jgi:hypothetical protein
VSALGKLTSCHLPYQNSNKDANTNLDNSLLITILFTKDPSYGELPCQSLPLDTKEKESILSKTDYNLTKNIYLSKKMRDTLTCLTIVYNLAGLVNAFLIPLVVDFLSSQVTWRVVLSRQANLRGSSSSCTMKPKDHMI